MGSPDINFWGTSVIIALITWYAIIPLLDYGLARIMISGRKLNDIQKARGALLLVIAVLVPSLTQSVEPLIYVVYGILVLFAFLSFYGLGPRQRIASAS